MEDTAYITYFNEFNLPIVFTFYLSDHFIYEDLPSTEGHPIQNVINRESKLTCTFRINGQIYSISDYQDHLSKLTERALTNVEKEYTYVPDRESFLSHIRQRINLCSDLINMGIASKSNCRFEWLDDPAIPAVPLKLEILQNDDYVRLYSPFIELQYASLSDFNSKFLRLFGSRAVKNVKPGRRSIMFSYDNLYKNVTLRREIHERFETLKQDLTRMDCIDVRSINPLLLYFGVRKDGPILFWKGSAGDFYAFNKRLKDLGILTGHNYQTLQKCVTIKDYVNWRQFRSLKPTLNAGAIIRIVDCFKKEMDNLSRNHST